MSPPALRLNVRDASAGATTNISQAEGSYNTNSHNYYSNVTHCSSNVQSRRSIDDVPRVQGWYWDISRACDEDDRIPFEDVFEDINDWIHQQTLPVNPSLLYRVRSMLSPPPVEPHVPLYLLLGGAYSGKSTILHTIVKMLAQDPSRVCLGAALFLSPDAGEPIDARRIVNTMIVDIASQSAVFRQHMSHTLETMPGIWHASASSWFHAFVVKPLHDPAVAPLGPFVAIINGLDQMEDGEDREQFIRFLIAEAKNFPLCLRIIISSRPTPDILEAFRGRHTCRYRFIYMDDRDITSGLRKKTAQGVVRGIAAARNSVAHDKLQALENCLAKAEPACTSIVDVFLSLCSGCELACFVKNVFRARGGKLSAGSVLRSIIDALAVHPPDGSCQEIDQILWDIATVPWRAGVPDDDDPTIFELEVLPTGPLSSIGRIYFDEASPQRILFEFRPEILALRNDSRKLGGLEWQIHQAKLHLNVLIHGLHYDMLSIKDKTASITAMDDLNTCISDIIPLSVKCASLDVISRITAIRTTQGAQPALTPLYRPLRKFLFKHLLHWLELLNWMRVPNASTVDGLNALIRWLEESGQDAWGEGGDVSDFVELVADAIKFVKCFSSVISTTPLQLPRAAARALGTGNTIHGVYGTSGQTSASDPTPLPLGDTGPESTIIPRKAQRILGYL